MADQKISELTDGDPAQSGDQIPVNRAGSNRRVTAGSIADLAAGDIASAIAALSSVYQPLDSDLTSIAALSTTAFGRGLLELADAAAGRSALAAASAADVDAIEAWLTANPWFDLAGGLLVPKHRGCLVALPSDLLTQNFTTAAAIPFGASSEIYDSDTIHDVSTANTRLSVPSGITYVRLSAQIELLNVGAAANRAIIDIRKGGAQNFAGWAGAGEENAGTNRRVNITTPIIPVTGGTDYFELFYQQVTDTSVTIVALQTWFAMELVA
jgi:hypothetical protein